MRNAILALICICSIVAGCATSQTNQAAQGMILTTTNANLALTLHQMHLTTPAQEKFIYELLRAEQAAATQYAQATLAGDSKAAAAAQAALAAATSAINAELAKYPKPPTTQP